MALGNVFIICGHFVIHIFLDILSGCMIRSDLLKLIFMVNEGLQKTRSVILKKQGYLKVDKIFQTVM